MRVGSAQDEDFEDFESRVDDVERTIKALMEGKIDPTEVDKKEEEILHKKQERENKKAREKQQQEAMMRKLQRENERKKWGFVGRWCPRCRKDEFQIFEQLYGRDDSKWPAAEQAEDHCTSKECSVLDTRIRLLTPDERRAQLQDRVEELKKERLAKALARDRWNRWKSTQQYNRVGAEWEEKYDQWDKWLPSDDEEDELPPAPPPDTPEFKMMEKDIDDRAKDKAERQRKAEELRKKGNAYFEEGKYRNAFAQYTKGLELDKSSRALLTNRALCCLKINNRKVTVVKLGEDVELDSFHQCIDDCTRCLDICEFLHDNVGPGIKASRVKAHMRRAEAKKRLGLLSEAVADVDDALRNIPDLHVQDKQQLSALKAAFEAESEAQERVTRLRAMAGVADGAAAAPVDEAEEAKDAADRLAADSEVAAEASTEASAGVAGVAVERVEAKGAARAASGVNLAAEESEAVAADIGSGGGGKGGGARKGDAAAYASEDGSVSLGTGQRVACWLDSRREQEVEGMIAFANDDETYDIVLDDGTEMDAVPRDAIRRLSPAAAEPVVDAGVRVEAPPPATATRASPSGQAAGVPVAPAPAPVATAARAAASGSKASGSAVAKGSMRKVKVVEDESEDEEEETKAAAASAGVAAAAVPGPGVRADTAAAAAAYETEAQSAALFAQRMAGMMSDPSIQQSLKNPRVQQVMADMMAGAGSAAAPSDDEVLEKYKHEPEVVAFYTKISQAMAGVLKEDYPCDNKDNKSFPPSQNGLAAGTQSSGKGKSNGGPKSLAEANKKTRKDVPPPSRQADRGGSATMGQGVASGLGGLEGLGAEAMSKLKDNADLREALKSPKMLEKLHSLMQAGPEGVQRAIAADAELAALEDKLMSALGMPAPAGPGGGGGAAAEADSSRQTKKRGWSRRMTVEERLKLSLVCVDAVKRAVAAYHTAAKEAGSRPADGLEVQDSALQALCSGVGEHAGQLEELVQDEDVVALVCDQAGVDAMCALAMALPALPPPAVGGSASVSGAAQALLLEAVHVLKAVAANSRCMTKVLEHDKGRTLVKMLASVQGVEPAAPAVQAGLAGLMEIGIQHDAIRRTLLKKSWNYAAAGAAAPQRVSLLAAAASAAADKRNPSLMEAALGCVTNAAFEEAGKEQLLAYEQGRAQGSVLDMALTIADSNPSGSGHAGASAGVLRAKAMRLLLNVTAAGPIRKLVGAGRGLGFLVRILDEQVAGAGGAAYSAAAADSLQHGQDVMDTALGLMMNLGLEDAHAEELVARGALTPLAAVLAGCPWSSCAARAAAAAARLLRFPAAAAQGRERGMLKALLLLIVRNAPGGGGGGAQVAEDGGVLSAATSARALEAACELLDPAVRALAQGLRNDEGSVRVVGEDTAALAALVATVRCGREGTVGNAALALQMVGNNDDHLERLGQAGAVPALLDVVHHMRGPAQRNAALALARVVKRPENLALLKALHGLDILNCYLKLK